MNNLKILNRHSIFYQNNTYYKNNLLYIKNKIKHTKIEIPKFRFVALSSNPSNLHKEKTSQKKKQTTTRHPNPPNLTLLVHWLMTTYIDDQNLDLYFKKSRNTSGRNTTRKYASQHNPTCKTKKNQERVTVNAQIVWMHTPVGGAIWQAWHNSVLCQALLRRTSKV